jgi:transcriptional regulator with XRE-family HTH domain
MTGEKWPEDPAGLFGMNLRLLREEKGMSQSEVARQMSERGHPWHQSTVYRVEQGKQEASYSEARDLAAILRTSMERFSWTGPEANGTAYVYAAGARLHQNYEQVAEAVEHLLRTRAAAERVLDQFKDSEYERVQEARADVAARMEDYDLEYAIQLGEWRYANRGREEEDTDDGEPDEEAAPAITEHRHNAGNAGVLPKPGSPLHYDPVAAVATLARGIPSIPPDQLRATLQAFHVAASPAITRAMSAWTSPDAQRSIAAMAGAARDLLAQAGMQPGTREADQLAVIAGALAAASPPDTSKSQRK